jgi:hypothetical protein
MKQKEPEFSAVLLSGEGAVGFRRCVLHIENDDEAPPGKPS